jgi:uncharacterized membrane protein YvbJ
MWLCWGCGQENDEASTYCENCGASREMTISVIRAVTRTLKTCFSMNKEYRQNRPKQAISVSRILA